MTVTEAERHELRGELRDVLPEGAVNTLMDSLPPMDWRELATKTDLAALEERMNARFDAKFTELDAKFAAVDAKFTEVAAGFTAVGAGFTAMDAKFTEMDAKFKAVEARITDVGAETKKDMAKLTRDIAKQTYVVLAGTAAIATPFYIALFLALFSGGG